MSTETTTTTDGRTDDELRKETLHQVEFYFADSNLPFDRFMWGLHTAKEDHWVPIATIASFKRMRPYTDKFGVAGVAEALRASTSLLEVDEAGENVRRKTEIKEPIGQFERTAYVKGFGDDKDNQTALEQFFKQFGAIAAVRIRRDDKKQAKDSCFVEFAEPTDMERFLALDPKPKYKDTQLLTLSKEAYCKGKLEEKGLPLSELDKMRKANTSHPRQRGFNAFKDADASAKAKPSVKKPEVYIKYLDSDIRVYRVGEDDPADGKAEDHRWVRPEDVPYVAGVALSVTGFGDTLEFNKIKGTLKEIGVDPTPFIEFKRGDTEAHLVFTKVVDDELFEKVKAALPKIGDADVTWTRTEQEVEHQLEQDRANALGQRALGDDAKPTTGRGGRGGGRGRGGRGGGRGGRGGRGGGRGGDGDRSAKKAAAPTEAKMEVDEAGSGGVKRKRDQVEPDGGITQGKRGSGIPTVKKAKTDDGES